MIHCTAYVGVSLDGYIAGPDDDLGWLDALPPPEGSDMGFGAFIESVDAIVMGRNTFAVVAGFDIDWPYTKPVIVMSSSLTTAPEGVGEVEFTTLGPEPLLDELESRGMSRIYIDGGAVITSFIRAGQLDELITTVIPVAIGGGTSLFGDLAEPQWFEHLTTEVFDNGMVQNVYRTRKDA